MDGQRGTRRGKGGRILPVVAVMPEEEEPHLLLTPQAQVFALAAKVFGNYLIRDIIVDHAIHGGSGSLDRSTVCFLRTVGKDWNDSLSKILHKNGEPLFEIHLAQETMLFGTSRSENNSELLNRLTNTFACSTLTFGLMLYPKAFKQENHQSLYNFLIGCGPGLVRIKLDFPMNLGSMRGTFPNLSLPSLQKAAIGFGYARLVERSSYSDFVINIVQSILSATTALKELKLCHYQYTGFPEKSCVFDEIILPPTLERVDFKICGADLECLLSKNHLPNLTSLELSISGSSMEVGLSRIFEKVGGTLKNLCLSSNSNGCFFLVALLRFPVMEKLEILELRSNTCYDLEAGIGSLEKYLPRLRVVHFSNQSEGMLGRWTNGSRFLSVEKLILESEYRSKVFDPACIGRIHLAFPNVLKLELRFGETPVPALQTIFSQLTNLVELKMITTGSATKQLEIGWDSLLIGTPVEIRVAPGPSIVREKIPLASAETPSIRNLAELQTFSLQDATYGSHTGTFITDLTFHSALLKMPRLKNLRFSQSFSVSPEMADMWRGSGRFLKYAQFYQND